jgi:hypothetical protein
MKVKMTAFVAALGLMVGTGLAQAGEIGPVKEV